MISICKYFYEADVSLGTSLKRGALESVSGGKVKSTGQAREEAENKLNQYRQAETTKDYQRLQALEKKGELKGHGHTASSADTDTDTGAEHAGEALEKGGEAAGEAVGSAGHHLATFAGEHGGAAGLIGGAILAALLAKKRKQD